MILFYSKGFREKNLIQNRILQRGIRGIVKGCKYWDHLDVNSTWEDLGFVAAEILVVGKDLIKIDRKLDV